MYIPAWWRTFGTWQHQGALLHQHSKKKVLYWKYGKVLLSIFVMMEFARFHGFTKRTCESEFEFCKFIWGIQFHVWRYSILYQIRHQTEKKGGAVSTVISDVNFNFPLGLVWVNIFKSLTPNATQPGFKLMISRSWYFLSLRCLL